MHSVGAMWSILFPFFIFTLPKPICNRSPPKNSPQTIERDGRGGCGVASVVMCLPSMHEGLGPILSTAGKIMKERNDISKVVSRKAGKEKLPFRRMA